VPKCHIEYYQVGTLAVDGWAVTFGIAKRRLCGPQPSPPRCIKM